MEEVEVSQSGQKLDLLVRQGFHLFSRPELQKSSWKATRGSSVQDQGKLEVTLQEGMGTVAVVVLGETVEATEATAT